MNFLIASIILNRFAKLNKIKYTLLETRNQLKIKIKRLYWLKNSERRKGLTDELLKLNDIKNQLKLLTYLVILLPNNDHLK